MPPDAARAAPAFATMGNAGRALSRAALALVGAAAIAACGKSPRQLDATAATDGDPSDAGEILALPPYGASLVESPRDREAALEAQRERELRAVLLDAGRKSDAGPRRIARPPYGAPGIDRDPSRF